MSEEFIDLGTVGDVMASILFRTMEHQCTNYKPHVSISGTKPKGIEEKDIKTVESLKGPSKRLVSRYLDQSRQFSNFDKKQVAKRKELRKTVDSLEDRVYNHLLESRPDTLSESYSKMNPETGEEEHVTILMKQHRQSGRLGKGDMGKLNKEAVEETMAALHPGVRLDDIFDDSKHLSYLQQDAFVKMYYDILSQKIFAYQDENKTFSTKVGVVKADRHSYV